MSTDERSVLLEAASAARSENYDPNEYCRSPPIMAARWWSYLNYSEQHLSGSDFMACVPASVFEHNIVKSFRAHYVAKRESSDFPRGMPIEAETYGSIEFNTIRNLDPLLKYCGSTVEHESQDFGWRFGTLLTSTDYTTNNIWWERLAD